MVKISYQYHDNTKKNIDVLKVLYFQQMTYLTQFFPQKGNKLIYLLHSGRKPRNKLNLKIILFKRITLSINAYLIQFFSNQKKD